MTSNTKVGLMGPYPLNRDTIAKVVSQVSPGVYVHSRDGKAAHYVGRSDQDVRRRLLDHVGSGYRSFWFAYASTPKGAFEQECTLFHRNGGEAGLDNLVHPQRPAGSFWKCPVCNIYA